MNEIELLQGLRAGLPGARPESRAAARAGLMARIEQSTPPARPRTAFRWRRPRLALVVTGIGFTALLVALPIGILGGGGEAEPAVAKVLQRTAEVAAEQEPETPGRGQFLYTRSKDAYMSSTPYLPAGERHPCTSRNPCDMSGAPEWSVLVPSEVETWVSFDDSLRGRTRHVLGKPRFVSAGQRAGWVAAGSPPLPRAGSVEDSAVSGSSMPFDASELPTDPAALREMIEAREIRGLGGPPGEAETFALIGDMLRRTYLPAAIRAALYELTAELPGVELLGKVEDPVGRPGTGIAYVDAKRGFRHELIFDPVTSALLGERETILRSGAYGFDAPPGTTIGYAAYLESKVVDSVGERPPAGAGKLDMSVGCYDRASWQSNVAILHDPDPIATCAELWREGAVDTRRWQLEREGKIKRPYGSSPPLVACVEEGSAVAHVFPGPGPSVCSRLGLEPWEGWQ